MIVQMKGETTRYWEMKTTRIYRSTTIMVQSTFDTTLNKLLGGGNLDLGGSLVIDNIVVLEEGVTNNVDRQTTASETSNAATAVLNVDERVGGDLKVVTSHRELERLKLGGVTIDGVGTIRVSSGTIGVSNTLDQVVVEDQKSGASVKDGIKVASDFLATNSGLVNSNTPPALRVINGNLLQFTINVLLVDVTKDVFYVVASSLSAILL